RRDGVLVHRAVETLADIAITRPVPLAEPLCENVCRCSYGHDVDVGIITSRGRDDRARDVNDHRAAGDDVVPDRSWHPVTVPMGIPMQCKLTGLERLLECGG